MKEFDNLKPSNPLRRSPPCHVAVPYGGSGKARTNLPSAGIRAGVPSPVSQSEVSGRSTKSRKSTAALRSRRQLGEPRRPSFPTLRSQPLDLYSKPPKPPPPSVELDSDLSLLLAIYEEADRDLRELQWEGKKIEPFTLAELISFRSRHKCSQCRGSGHLEVECPTPPGYFDGNEDMLVVSDELVAHDSKGHTFGAPATIENEVEEGKLDFWALSLVHGEEPATVVDFPKVEKVNEAAYCQPWTPCVSLPKSTPAPVLAVDGPPGDRPTELANMGFGLSGQNSSFPLIRGSAEVLSEPPEVISNSNLRNIGLEFCFEEMRKSSMRYHLTLEHAVSCLSPELSRFEYDSWNEMEFRLLLYDVFKTRATALMKQPDCLVILIRMVCLEIRKNALICSIMPEISLFAELLSPAMCTLAIECVSWNEIGWKLLLKNVGLLLVDRVVNSGFECLVGLILLLYDGYTSCVSEMNPFDDSTSCVDFAFGKGGPETISLTGFNHLFVKLSTGHVVLASWNCKVGLNFLLYEVVVLLLLLTENDGSVNCSNLPSMLSSNALPLFCIERDSADDYLNPTSISLFHLVWPSYLSVHVCKSDRAKLRMLFPENSVDKFRL